MTNKLTLDTLTSAVRGGAAALRINTRLQPAGGVGDKIYPASFGGGKYAYETRIVDGQEVSCVLVDSVASQANRMEAALLDAWRDERVSFPVMTVDFGKAVDEEARYLGELTTLDMPHRVYDALIRDSMNADGVPFVNTPVGKRLCNVGASPADLFELCPTALLFGTWNSTTKSSTRGLKVRRSLVSEMTAYNVKGGVSMGTRIDPAQISKEIELVERPSPEFWAFAEKSEKGKKKPSALNHGSVPAESSLGGVTCSYVQQTTVLSFGAIRALRLGADRNVALAAFGILAVALNRDYGYDLRARCTLVPEGVPSFELVNSDGTVEPVSITSAEAVELFNAATTSIGWEREPARFVPSEKLSQLVAKSLEKNGDAEDA